VDIYWQNAKAEKVVIKSKSGNKCSVRSTNGLKLKSGWFGPKAKKFEENMLEFNTKAGKSYVLTCL